MLDLADLLLFVVVTLFIGYVPPFKSLPIHPVAKFAFSLISIIPLAYYIGMALSRCASLTEDPCVFTLAVSPHRRHWRSARS